MLESVIFFLTNVFFITKSIHDIILIRRYFFMIKIYDTENCAKCRLTERLFNVANVDFEVVKPHNSDIQRFREQGFQSYPVVETPDRSWCGFRPDLIKKIRS